MTQQFLNIYQKELKAGNSKTHVYTHVYGRIIHDSEELKAIHGPINGRIDT